MDPWAGRVTVDGQDVRDLSLAGLRQKISIVPQDTFLFNDTVANNIRYGRQDVTGRGIKEAARNALCEEFILQMPQSYETLIGERGLKLSGGQRQRIRSRGRCSKTRPSSFSMRRPVTWTASRRPWCSRRWRAS
jgi:ABC-type multidrug transport system fused ATPase/permease subunit